MQQGNWVPISKALVKALPSNRPYTELEAMFSLTVNYDNGRRFSVSGLSKLWGWSRKKVSGFLDRIGVDLVLVGGPSRRAPKEQLTLQLRDNLGASKGQVNFIDSKWLDRSGSNLGASKEQLRSKLGSTYTDPDPNPKPKEQKDEEEWAQIFSPT